jgi:hypothetical protein
MKSLYRKKAMGTSHFLSPVRACRASIGAGTHACKAPGPSHADQARHPASDEVVGVGGEGAQDVGRRGGVPGNSLRTSSSVGIVRRGRPW